VRRGTRDVDAAVMKPAALVLNLATSVPFALLGGAIQLPGHWYKQLVGAVLLVAASRLSVESRRQSNDTRHARPPLAWPDVVCIRPVK
jgi:uncharacterized membrane protein YfcA